MHKPQSAMSSSASKTVGWLPNQPQDFRDAILARARIISLEAGESLAHPHGPAVSLIGVEEGCLALPFPLMDGETVTSHLVWPGEWVGEIAFLMNDLVRRMGMEARMPTRILQVSNADMRNLFADRPDWWPCIANLAVLQSQLAIQSAIELMIRDSAARCMARLLRLSGHPNPANAIGDEAFVPLSQEQLARVANLSRNSVSKVLTDLKKKGLIEIKYGVLRVPSTAALEHELSLSLEANE